MLGNWLSVVLRSAVKHRLYSVINILGLAVGLAACLLIGLFVRHELSFDRFWPEAGRIYRVVMDIQVPGHPVEPSASAIIALGPFLEQDLPEIEDSLRLVQGRINFTVGDTPFQVPLHYADGSLLDFFPMEFIAGDPATALDAPLKVVLTEATARRLFGRIDVLGATLRHLERTFVVSGVIRDMPVNTHLDIEAVTNVSSGSDRLQDIFREWNRTAGWTYVKLHEGAAATVVA